MRARQHSACRTLRGSRRRPHAHARALTRGMRAPGGAAVPRRVPPAPRVPPHLECQQQQERLHRVEAPVHEVAHEQVVGLRAVAAHLEQLHEVVELAMDVPTCGRGARQQRGGCRGECLAAPQAPFLLPRCSPIRHHSHTVTGESTRCTLDSSTSTSRARWHSCFTSCSFSGSHFFRCSIHLRLWWRHAAAMGRWWRLAAPPHGTSTPLAAVPCCLPQPACLPCYAAPAPVQIRLAGHAARSNVQEAARGGTPCCWPAAAAHIAGSNQASRHQAGVGVGIWVCVRSSRHARTRSRGSRVANVHCFLGAAVLPGCHASPGTTALRGLTTGVQVARAGAAAHAGARRPWAAAAAAAAWPLVAGPHTAAAGAAAGGA